MVMNRGCPDTLHVVVQTLILLGCASNIRGGCTCPTQRNGDTHRRYDKDLAE